MIKFAADLKKFPTKSIVKLFGLTSSFRQPGSSVNCFFRLFAKINTHKRERNFFRFRNLKA